MNPPKRTEAQTPAQYEAARREWARDSKLCTSCISTGSDRKPGFAIDRKTGKYRIDPVTRKRIRKETCDVCLARKENERKRRVQNGAIGRTSRGDKTAADIAAERTKQARLENKCITCRKNPVTPGPNRRSGQQYLTCEQCRSTSKARRAAVP